MFFQGERGQIVRLCLIYALRPENEWEYLLNFCHETSLQDQISVSSGRRVSVAPG